MLIKVSLFALLFFKASLGLAQDSKSEDEPNIWEKAKKIGNEVWNGKLRRPNSEGVKSNKEPPEGESSESMDSGRKIQLKEEGANEPAVRDSKLNRSNS